MGGTGMLPFQELSSVPRNFQCGKRYSEAAIGVARGLAEAFVYS